MRNRTPGKICEHLWYLGREESGVYLLEGEKASMLISGGMSYLVPDLLEQFGSFGIDESEIGKLLILHAHFDHAGIVPFFKRRNPRLQIYASARGWKVLQNRKAIQTINEFSRMVAERMRREEVYARYDLDWKEGAAGMTVAEGDSIDLGGLEARIFETPGHSSCSISAYVPKLKALFASDGGGVPYGEIIVASGNSNFTDFQKSLEKLKDLETDYVCADHYGYVVGDEAKGFIRRTIEFARQNRASMEEAYREEGSIEKAAKRLTEAFYREKPDWIVSPEIVEGVHRQMIRHIANAGKGEA